MKLEGVLEYSLGGFLTLRGYAKIGDLAKISIADRDFQRELINEHQENLIKFLESKEFLFFPEIILSVSLINNNEQDQFYDEVEKFYEKIKHSESFKSIKFSHVRVSHSSKENKLTIYLKDEHNKLFSRIDGNHRLSAVEKILEDNPDASVKDLQCPFSIIIFRNVQEKNKFSRVLFNNINSKAIPVSLEHNIKLIIDDVENYSDDKLKNDPSFGWAFYFTRKLYHELDLEYLPNLKDVLENKKASGLLNVTKFLLIKNVIKEEENSLKKLKNSLAGINNLYEDENLKKSKSVGLFGAFLYYYIKNQSMLNSFKQWVIENHISLVDSKIDSNSIVDIYDKIISSKRRTIFVSMPFREETNSHYETMKRVINEINKEFNLKIKLKLHRVDWFEDGTSYEITEKIFELIDRSGLLIADLTFANPNVYHEVGYLMGRNRTQNKRSYSNFLLILNEQYASNADKNVAFNLRGLRQIRFKNNEELGRELKSNIKKFFRLENES